VCHVPFGTTTNSPGEESLTDRWAALLVEEPSPRCPNNSTTISSPFGWISHVGQSAAKSKRATSRRP